MRSLLSFWFAFLLLGAPFFVQAQTTTDSTTGTASTACVCYCKGSTGADLASGGTDESPTADSTTSACSSTCQSRSETMLGCYGEDQVDSLPTNNLLCWSEYECTSQVSTDPNTSGQPYEWSGQKSVCPSGEGYCYAPHTPVTLGVVIDDLSSADGLPDYINAIYNWLIPAGALVAVVMIMIGGMQYVIARGDPKGIGSATTRIRYAVEGMVLLMCAYFILNLIDPGLVTLKDLRTPQVRRVVYLDPSSTCEYMLAQGITITAGDSTSCGGTGTIASVDGFVGGGTPSVSVGDSCRYSACDDPLATCISSSTADGGYACVRCANAANDIAGNPFADAPAPSESTCSSLKRSDSGSADEHQYCEYYDGSFSSATDSNACVELVYPSGDSTTSLDCARLKSDAMAGDSESCRAYDLVWAIAGVMPNTTSGLYSNEVDDKNGANNDYQLLATLCAADPCGLHPPGDTCQALVVQNGVTSTICSLPIVSELALCQLATEGDRADCVTASYAAAMQKVIGGEDLTDADTAALQIQDITGQVVDYNPTW